MVKLLVGLLRKDLVQRVIKMMDLDVCFLQYWIKMNYQLIFMI